MAAFDPERCVFGDERGTHLAHTRAYDRAPRGERAVGRVPHHRGRVTTLLAGLTPAGMGPARTWTGGTTKDAFLAYLREDLAPTLQPGKVVILDHLGAHQPRDVRARIAGRGARLVDLPASSPDFNPIETAFGMLKAQLRRVETRTCEALAVAIHEALAAVSPAASRGFSTHCGFLLPDQS